MHRTTVVMICVLLLGCHYGSERSNAQEANDDKFGHHKEKEANFVIDILDTSYGLIDLAKLGESRIDDPQQKAQIQRIIQMHTSAMIQMKTYAERRGIAIPLSGPEKSRTHVKRLQKEKSPDFRRAWAIEMRELQHKLKIDIEGYQRRAIDTALLNVLDSTLLMVKKNNEIISGFESGNSGESI